MDKTCSGHHFGVLYATIRCGWLIMSPDIESDLESDSVTVYISAHF